MIQEATLMVCAQVIGNDAAVTVAGASGNFELNVMMPVIGRNVLESLTLLTNALTLLADTTVAGITSDPDRLRHLAESSLSIATPLNRVIGYEAAAAVAKHAITVGCTIREAVHQLGYVERGEISEGQLDALLDVGSMTEPG